MTNETIFQIANALVLPQWVLMVVAPRWRGTQWLTRSMLVPGLLAVAYVWYIGGVMRGNNDPAGGLDFRAFSTLAGVSALFGRGPSAVLPGWIHYLAFDLVAGSWLLRDGQERHIPHGFLVPCLALCFMLGPAGLLLYLLIRAVRSLTNR